MIYVNTTIIPKSLGTILGTFVEHAKKIQIVYSIGMKNLIFGAHMSMAKGFVNAARKTVEDYGANAMQFFVKSPRGGQAKPLSDEEANQFKKYCHENSIKFITAHASYLINLSKTPKQAPWQINDLVGDFERVHKLGGNGVVVHLGKASGGLDPETAIKVMLENIKVVLEKTQHTKLLFILENTAGQKSDIGFEFPDLGEIWKHVKPLSKRMRICLDTAHSWAAGYNWGNAEKVFKEFDEYVGIENLACFHFNDAKFEVNCHVDRHENIFQGKMPRAGLIAIAKFAEKHQIPLIMETPGDAKGDHHAEIKELKAELA